MSKLLLVRLGSGDFAEGRRTLYAAIDNDRVAEVLGASNDDEALTRVRELAAGGDVECENKLEAVARRRKAPVRPLTAAEKIIKAHVAAPMLEKSTYRGVTEGEALMDFFETAAAFARAVAPDPSPEWHVGATLRGSIAGTTFDQELFLLVVPGAQPMLCILSRADASWMFAHDAELTSVDHTAVQFRAEPGELSSILDDAYGLTTIPHVTIVERGTPRAPDNIAFEYLAGCLAAIARHVVAKAPGIFYDPMLGGELDIKLATFQPTAA